jgi:hypothetical protein
VHKEKVNVAGVVDEESLVTGRHHVASLLVGSETNLTYLISPYSACCSSHPGVLGFHLSCRIPRDASPKDHSHVPMA